MLRWMEKGSKLSSMSVEVPSCLIGMLRTSSLLSGARNNDAIRYKIVLK